MADVPPDPFRHFESLLMSWLQGARLLEIARVLELMAEELRRRAKTADLPTNPFKEIDH